MPDQVLTANFHQTVTMLKNLNRFLVCMHVGIIGILFTPLSNFANKKPSYPILVLATSKNFGTFTGEILRAEGFNAFRLEPLTNNTTLPYLKQFNLVILAETAINDQQRLLLDKYVRDGGNLIAFRPDKKLDPVFGIKTMNGNLPAGYLSINNITAIGSGLLAVPLKLQGDASLIELNGASAIAKLLAKPGTSTTYPALVFHNYGKGHAMAFSYNLPGSIVLTRQGDDRKAGEETDGITGIRAMDLFTDSWVDTAQNILNQADEQMRLLSHGIEHMNSFIMPMPRFWYFPDSLKCLVTLNNDGEDNREDEFRKQFEDVYAKGAKMTLYVKETDLISSDWINGWINKGFEIAGHYDDTNQATNPDWKTMDSVYGQLNKKLTMAYGIDSMLTVTNHWFVWCGKDEAGKKDFAAQARIEEKHGIRLDCNYAHYDNGSSQGHFLGPFGRNHGNYTGSGLPMKFAARDGSLVNVYQHLNNVYDQQYMEHDDKDGFLQSFKGLVDRSLESEVYSYVSIKAHNAEYFFSEKPLMQMLDYANLKNIPVWNELELLRFLQTRDEAWFSNLQWSGNQFTFTLHSSVPNKNKLSFLLPNLYSGQIISRISANGKRVNYTTITIKGTAYAQVCILPGNNYDFEIEYSK